VAAGLITSPQGLREVPHVEAPATVHELVAGSVLEHLPDICAAPVLFIPGVRSGPSRADRGTVTNTDIMRGEEVLCLGLQQLGDLPAGGVVLTIGSHWKAIEVDRARGITRSFTTLSGELVHAVCSQTLIASAVPQERPDALDPDWVEAGAAAFASSGLARALFSVRLLQQRTECTPEQRFAFLMGAVIASDVPILVRGTGRVVVTGAHVVANAWATFLRRRAVDAVVVNEDHIDRAFRAGCQQVVSSRAALPL
jgi:2-dehydro-3-deoxygalactonokinase